jgi:hypothetical protein
MKLRTPHEFAQPCFLTRSHRLRADGVTVRHVRVQATPEAVRLVQEQGGTAVCMGKEIALLPRLVHLPRDVERASHEAVPSRRRRRDRALPRPEPRQPPRARDRSEGTSPSALARVLGRLRVRRLDLAPTRARGKVDKQTTEESARIRHCATQGCQQRMTQPRARCTNWGRLALT